MKRYLFLFVTLWILPLSSADPDPYRAVLEPADLKQTWVEMDGETYGARPGPLGPIGGGAGYLSIVRNGDFRVGTLDELLTALAEARAGQTIFVEGSARIDLSVPVRIEKQALRIPAGVTLASDRGWQGSPGALLYSDEFATDPLFEAAGPDVRLSGLRLRGPDPDTRERLWYLSFREGRGRPYYYQFPRSSGIRTESDRLVVENCEVYGWSHSGIALAGGQGHHVHHSFIHNNQRWGLGYGVFTVRAFALIEYNLFDSNRHSIAGSGSVPSGFEARHNVEGPRTQSHSFDMHGGRDRKDGTDLAGTRMEIHHNTFMPDSNGQSAGEAYAAIHIRGQPEESAEIHHNWFPAASPSPRLIRTYGRVVLGTNAFGPDQASLKVVAGSSSEP